MYECGSSATRWPRPFNPTAPREMYVCRSMHYIIRVRTYDIITTGAHEASLWCPMATYGTGDVPAGARTMGAGDGEIEEE